MYKFHPLFPLSLLLSFCFSFGWPQTKPRKCHSWKSRKRMAIFYCLLPWKSRWQMQDCPSVHLPDIDCFVSTSLSDHIVLGTRGNLLRTGTFNAPAIVSTLTQLRRIWRSVPRGYACVLPCQHKCWECHLTLIVPGAGLRVNRPPTDTLKRPIGEGTLWVGEICCCPLLEMAVGIHMPSLQRLLTSNWVQLLACFLIFQKWNALISTTFSQYKTAHEVSCWIWTLNTHSRDIDSSNLPLKHVFQLWKNDAKCIKMWNLWITAWGNRPHFGFLFSWKIKAHGPLWANNLIMSSNKSRSHPFVKWSILPHCLWELFLQEG